MTKASNVFSELLCPDGVMHYCRSHILPSFTCQNLDTDRSTGPAGAHCMGVHRLRSHGCEGLG